MACWEHKGEGKIIISSKESIELVEKGNETFVEYINCTHKKKS